MWKLILTALWLTALGGIDMRRKYVPAWLLACGGIFATVMSVFGFYDGELDGTGLLWSIFPGVVLLILGILAGFRACIFSFTLSMLIISVVSLILLALRRVRKNTKLPYLPFLCVGYLVQAVLGLAA